MPNDRLFALGVRVTSKSRFDNAADSSAGQMRAEPRW
jgi:hypothetical protein